MTKRHSWSDPVRYLNKTERTCRNCPLVKVTRREPYPPWYWTEFWRDGERIQCEGTPACEPVKREAA